jgi:hypothetical protein
MKYLGIYDLSKWNLKNLLFILKAYFEMANVLQFSQLQLNCVHYYKSGV